MDLQTRHIEVGWQENIENLDVLASLGQVEFNGTRHTDTQTFLIPVNGNS